MTSIMTISCLCLHKEVFGSTPAENKTTERHCNRKLHGSEIWKTKHTVILVGFLKAVTVKTTTLFSVQLYLNSRENWMKPESLANFIFPRPVCILLCCPYITKLSHQVHLTFQERTIKIIFFKDGLQMDPSFLWKTK